MPDGGPSGGETNEAGPVENGPEQGAYLLGGWTGTEFPDSLDVYNPRERRDATEDFNFVDSGLCSTPFLLSCLSLESTHTR